MNSYQTAIILRTMNSTSDDFLRHENLIPTLHECFVWYFTRATLTGETPPTKETVILWVLSDLLDITKNNKPFAQDDEREPTQYIGIPHNSDPLPLGAY
jgi:hypothetical protein